MLISQPVEPAAEARGGIEVSSSCPDHACDGCYVCRTRRCCRQDRPDFPRFGDWTDLVHGELGRLTLDEDDKVICHVCGKAYHSLDHHVRQAHDLWPEEYRVLFGLARGTALESPSLRARRRELADEPLRPWREKIREVHARTTREQRAMRSRAKGKRLESLGDPVNQQHWEEARQRSRATPMARLQSGDLQLPAKFSDPSVRRAALLKARTRRQELLQDPAYREQLGERLRTAKAAREPVTCIVCGRAFDSPRSSLRRGYGKICGDECRVQWRLQRGRGRDGRPWQQVAEQLRVLGPAALEAALTPPLPEIVRRFYGLADGTPWTQQQIARSLGLHKVDVQRLLTGPAVTRLLGEPGRRPDRRRVAVPCAICQRPVERTLRETRDRIQTTCSPACRLEWQRRQVAQLTAGTASVRRVEHLREKTASPEFRQRMRLTARQRSRPHADALRALAPEAFATLPNPERHLVRGYYGLDGEPRSLAELAREVRMGKSRVRQLIIGATTRLLLDSRDP